MGESVSDVDESVSDSLCSVVALHCFTISFGYLDSVAFRFIYKRTPYITEV